MTEDKPPRKKSSSSSSSSTTTTATAATSGRNLQSVHPPCETAAIPGDDNSKPIKEAAPRKKSRLVGIRSRISIEELKSVYKRQVSQSQEDTTDHVFDPMAKAQESTHVVRGKTGVIYSEEMTKHFCLWDPNHPEKPDRFTCILERCRELGLLDECLRLECRVATEEEVLKLHSPTHLSLLQTTSYITDANNLEDLCARFDYVYINSATYECALLAAGSTLELVDAIVTSKIQNGFAIVRPPGHHAMESEFCGYCLINNVCLATQRALETHKLSRILIVDWDVHHGQGTQRTFYNDPRVLYFSIHRFEHGTYWPNLRESNYDYIGEGPGKGFNFNVPLNTIGMCNQDYLAILHQVLLPVAYEFNPELVIVSAGFDAALGCPEGEMSLSPGLYAHFTSHLMALAQGKVAAVLEGGYHLGSLSESAAMTLSALLGHPPPTLLDPITQPSQSLQESLLSLVYMQRPYWKCLQYQGTFTQEEVVEEIGGGGGWGKVHPKHFTPSLLLTGVIDNRPLRFPTRNNFVMQTPEFLQEIDDKLKCLREKECVMRKVEPRLCLVYDKGMELHHSLTEGEHPERPERIRRVWEKLKDAGIVKRSRLLEPRVAVREEVELVHSKEHVDSMFTLQSMEHEELQILQESYKSVYLHSKTNYCALLSAGCLLQVVEEVCKGRARSGIGPIRPPGHHAEPDRPHGFCFYNNVAIAARHAIQNLGCQRVLIMDWDVHHGNGIQHTFEEEPRVLYVSLHRYDHGLFFPSSEDANYDRVGKGPGEGYTINIPWNKSGMGDAEYMAAFTQVVMPVAYQYNPDLVLVAAGFDAARGDPLGGCRMSPECFGHLTLLLSCLAGGKVVLALEGGYNLTTISYCMTLCAKALLGDPIPSLEPQLVPNKSAVQSINDVIRTHAKYWPALCFQIDLPLQDVLQQGCGGGRQELHSGRSGSEASHSPSPVSSPCVPKSSPDSSPSSTSPYVSAPSSPFKPILVDAEAKANVVQCLTESKDTALSVGARPRTLSPGMIAVHTPSRPKPERPARGQRSAARRQGRVQEAMQAALSSQGQVKGATGVVCIEREKGDCHGVVRWCEEFGVWQKCTVLPPQTSLSSEITLKHLPLATESLRTDESSLLVAANVSSLLQKTQDGTLQNGMVMMQSLGGWNSGVAMAIHSLVATGDKGRVLVVDWCGHNNGSGLQHMFVNECQVVFLSVRQSQDTSTKQETPNSKRNRNIVNINLNYNMTLNPTSDCYALAHHVVLPIAYEYGPEVVVMVFACEWLKHPGFLPTITGLLSPIAGCRLTLIVEVDGQSSEESNEAIGRGLCTLSGSLLPSTETSELATAPSIAMRQTILEVMKTYEGTWESLRHHALVSFLGCVGVKGGTSPSQDQHIATHQSIPPIATLKGGGECMKGDRVCLVYSEAMKQHLCYTDDAHPETPDRISCIFEQLNNFGIVQRCRPLKAREATTKEVEGVHSARHIKFMSGLQAMKPSELQQVEDSFDSIYLHRRTNHAALLAVGSIIESVDCVLSGVCDHGVAVVRPPGHHAERNHPCGFCFYNSVGVAAHHAITTHHLDRVLVLDWDVHHGNGTQHMFECDPRVLYISIHRYDHAKFFPGSKDANYDRVGLKKGKGFNINIPWNKGGMGDAEYMAAFLQVVLPVATQFNPQLVLVSAGFDAAVGDPLGGCNVTPECYGHMTKFLTAIGNRRVIVALEGGYNLTSISYCMTMCSKALLGDPLPSLSASLVPCQSAVETLTNVVQSHYKFWSVLNFKGEVISASPKKQDLNKPSHIGSPLHITPTGNEDEGLPLDMSKLNLNENTSTQHKGEQEEPMEEAQACGLPSNITTTTTTTTTTLIVGDTLTAEEMYAVVPASWCPHLEEVKPIPGDGIINTSTPCEECQDTSENWCCLTCYKVLCGRFVNEHMLMHGLCEQHHMVLSFSDLSTWCYACDVYVHNPTLFEAKRAAHLDKFGEEPPA